MNDRIETTYNAIDEMVELHGKPKPDKFGGGLWDAEKEFKFYKLQVGKRYTELQWSVITSYFKMKFNRRLE
jgi:hypothetical protein